jgi:cytoplasmic iron level regulating protein YaaA (DUF328/UPF0246 family)
VLTILLPPSEGKAPGGDGPGWAPDDGRFGAALADHRRQVAEALAACGGGDARMLGARGATLERAREANATLVGAPTLPAWRRFTGVVWEHLDVAGLDPAARRRATGGVVVVSALAGLSALADPLPDFRLKLTARPPGLPPLAGWWRPVLTEVLQGRLRGRLVVDLLPNEHAAAVDLDPGAGRYDLVRVRLVRPDGTNAGHAGKAAKGLLARALLEADDPERTLGTWRHPEVRLELDHPTR